MCTVGTLRLGGPSYLLFKNKDFGRHHFNDRLTLSRDVFGVRGISTWAGSDPAADRFSGFSIGANRHGLFCADSNVREEPEGGSNYDVLTEIALNEGCNVDSAVDALKKALRAGPYWCANLIMIDPSTIAVVEVRGDDLYVTRETNHATRTNHHVHFGPTDSDHDTVTSETRLECSSRRLGSAQDLGDILELQGSHDDRVAGICNHTHYQTVYSYVLAKAESGIRLLVTKGHPCGRTERHDLPVPLGVHWSTAAETTFRSSYPSDHAFLVDD